MTFDNFKTPLHKRDNGIYFDDWQTNIIYP